MDVELLVSGTHRDGNDSGISTRAHSVLPTRGYARLSKVKHACATDNLNMTLLHRNLLRRFPRLSLPLNTLACTVSFGLALPMSIALFPQKAKVNIDASSCPICRLRSLLRWQSANSKRRFKRKQAFRMFITTKVSD